MGKKGLLLVLMLAVLCMTPVVTNAGPVGVLEIIDPHISYVQGTDFLTFEENYVRGDVTAPVQLVPHYGLNDADFYSGGVSMVTGKIALISRGPAGDPFAYFSTKANNAFEAGAVGAVVFNDNQAWPGAVTLQDPTFIPCVFASADVGDDLLAVWLGVTGGSNLIHLRVGPAAVPEPTTMLLLGFGLVGLVGVRRLKN